MPRSLRVLLAFLLLALPLGVLGGAGAVTALRQLDRSREAAVDHTVGTVVAALTDAGATLRREAITLARDPALVEGTAKGDWATMVRWASPRLLAVTRDGMADLLVLRDARGAPLVQVPAVPPPAWPELPAVTEPRVTLALVGGRPHLLAMAPIASSSASEEASRIPAGVIVLGRRFEAIARGIDTLPSRPAVVLVTGDLALAVTRPGVPAAGWAEATRSGRLGTDGETFAVRPLDLRDLGAAAGSLWALVPDTEFQLVRRQFWRWLVALGAAAAVLLAVGAWLLTRRPRPPRPAREPRADDARSPAALEQRNHELAAEYLALLEVGRLVSSTLDVDRVLDVIVERCCALMGVTAAGIFTGDGTDGDLTYARGVGFSPEFVASLRMRMGEGATGRAMRDREPVWTRDLLSDPRITLSEETRALVRREGYCSVLSAPILSKGEVHGAVVAYWWEPHEPTASEIALMEALAGQVAIALENARLYQAATDRGQRLATLARLTESLTATLSLDDVLSRVVDGAVGLYSASVAGLWLMNEDGRSLSLRAEAGGPSPLSGPSAVAVGEGLIGSIVTTRSPLVVPDLRMDARAGAPTGQADAVIGVAGIPLALGDRVLGVLSVALGEARPFSEEDLNLLQSLANHAATAIENARLYAETKHRLEESRALLEVADILNSTLDPKQLLKRVAIKIAQVCGVDRCSIERWDGDRVIPLMSQFADGHRDERLWQIFSTMPGYAPREVPAHALAIETRRPVIISDATTTDLIPREWIETFEHKSFLAVPLIRQDTVLGLMTLDHTQRVTPFEPWQVDLATAIAKQIALSIENARLYGEAQERLQETSTLLAVGRVLSEPGPSVESMRRVAREVALAFGADMAGVFMLDPAKKLIRPVAGYHVPKHLIEMFQGRPLRVEHFPALEQTWAERRAIWSSDIRSDPRFDQASFEGVEPMSVLLAPTPVRGQAVGALCLVWWRPGREFAPAEVRLLEGVAAQVALALENTELAHQTQRKLEETENLLSQNASLFRDNQRRVQELSVLHELSRAVTGQLDEAGLLETIEQQMTRLLDVRHMIILLYDEDRDELDVVLRVRDGVRYQSGPRRYRRRAAGLAGVVLDTGRAIRTDDYLGECGRRGVQPVPESVDIPSWLGVPMTAADRIMGVLALRSRERGFTESDEGLLANIADLTALALRSARLYEERARAHAELAAAQDQLIRTEKLRAMGEMASGVAHDFNNVLASIVGRAQLLLGRVEDPKLRQWIQVIERAAMDGARTVRQLQDFTRVRRDHPVVAVDLNQVIQHTLEATEPSWRQEPRSRGVEIEVTTSLSVPLPRISGDPADLREALTNLILNALDAMPEGGRLRLASDVVTGRVEVTVSDSGVGIAESIRHKIFDPFFTTKGPKGTGLGLSMTYGILSRHGARVTVESEEGRGATFRLSFPMAEGVEESTGAAVSKPAAATPLRCLVVDDEEAVADVLGDILMSAGHKAAVVTSGARAVDRLRSEPFDVVLTDLAMPGMTGWEVARAVKAVAPTVRVLLVSGFGVEVSTDDMRAHGVDMVLAKPIRYEDLIGALASLRLIADE